MIKKYYWDERKTKIRCVEHLNAEEELHREDGPARIDYREDGSVEYEYWCLNDMELEDEEVQLIRNKLKIRDIISSLV